MPTPRLDLAELEQIKRFPGITEKIAGMMAEAAGVCFHKHQHPLGVTIAVSGIRAQAFATYWPEPANQTVRAWNDMKVATEWGAYGTAILLIEALTPYTVIARSWTGTGFDYWLGDQKDLSELEDPIGFPFDQTHYKARLEVSGIFEGTEQEVKRRVQIKLDQTNPSDGLGLPAYIVVVEFSKPCAEVVQK